MESNPGITTTLAAKLPAFADLSEAQLSKLSALFEQQVFEPGQTVFEAGSPPGFLRILVAGSLSIQSDAGEVFEVRAEAAIGELSALTGEARNMRAVAADRATVLAAPVDKLEHFLRGEGEIGFVLQRNLLRLASRKIGRDRRRLLEMKGNIINTQHAMKRMREALLEGEGDNPLHAALFEELDALIEQNRKVHYLVEPSRLVPTHVRHADGSRGAVTAFSVEWLYFARPSIEYKVGQEISLVLDLDGDEVPVSGVVERSDEKEVAVYLDNMIPAYEGKLKDHSARAQLLDVVL